MTYRTLPIPTYIVPTSDTQSQAVLHAQVTSSHSKTSYCSCSVVKSHPTLCNPMDCSTPGFPVLHYLPEFAQTHVHRVSDAIQPSYPLSSSSPFAITCSQHQSFFQWVSFSHQVAKVLEFQLQHQSFQWHPSILVLILLKSFLWSSLKTWAPPWFHSWSVILHSQ